MTPAATLAMLARIGRLVLLVPFLAMALLGQGVMPQATGHGITLVLCSVDGPVEMTLDPVTGAPVEPAQDRQCDWAAAQAVALVTDTAVAVAPVMLRPTEPLRETFAHNPAHDPRGLFARGPPILT